VPPNTLNGSPCVLIVDDEDLLRDVLSVMIEEAGGKVFTAVDGQHGVDVFRERSSEIDIVFMDFSMPRMNGYQAYLEMKEIHPETPIILCSGLTLTPEVEALRRSKAVEVLSKPFHQEDLFLLINKLVKPRLPMIRP
jgi:CheY-like chemotaxis protein